MNALFGGIFHEERGILFACHLCSFQIDFFSKLQAVYWVVAPKFIKYATA